MHALHPSRNWFSSTVNGKSICLPVWLPLPPDQAEVLVAAALAAGFNLHQAADGVGISFGIHRLMASDDKLSPTETESPGNCFSPSIEAQRSTFADSWVKEYHS